MAMTFVNILYLVTAEKRPNGTTRFVKEKIPGRVINTEGLSRLVDECNDFVYINTEDEGLYRKYIESKLGMHPFRNAAKQRRADSLESFLCSGLSRPENYYTRASTDFKNAFESIDKAARLEKERAEKQEEYERLLEEIAMEEAEEFARLFGEE